MSAAIVLVWLGTETARAAHEPDLASWAAARMVTIEDPLASRDSTKPRAHDDVTAQRVESLVAEALTAAYSADGASAAAALKTAEDLLIEHPELPEGAWLMAEVWRQRAELIKDNAPEESEALLGRATELGGPHAVPFDAVARRPATHTPSPKASERSEATAPPTRDPAVNFVGPLPGDRVEVDGAVVGVPLATARGTHQVRVLRHDELVWAGWVNADAPTTALPMPSPAPCSDADLAVRATKDGVDAGTARCPRFAVARAAPGDGVEIVTCFGTSCGSWLPWKHSWGATFEAPVQPPWPPAKQKNWIIWTAAGVVAVAAGGLLLWQEGAFERHESGRDTFVWTPRP